MKSKQNIDRLFREQFKDFESAPPPEVWNSISSQLHPPKKQRRLLPLWYKIAGVAALLLIIFSVGDFFYNSDTPSVTGGDSEILIENAVQNVKSDSQITMPATLNENATDTRITSTPLTDAITEGSDTQNVKSPASKKDAVNETARYYNENRGIATASEKDKSKNQIFSPSEEEKIPSEILENKAIIAEKSTIESNGVTQLSEEVLKEDESIAIKTDTKKSLQEYLKEKEESVTKEDNKETGRWEVAPNFAPVYYSSLGSGSSIDPKFSDNPKSGDVNYSYGVQVSYAINDKFSIRTGVNKLDLSYATNDIEFAASTQSAALSSINYNNRDLIVAIGPRGSLSPSSNVPIRTEDGYVIVPRSGIIAGSFTQQLDYLEIPVELKYTLLDSRFGINMIGGISTLLLGNNDLIIQSEGFNNSIGSANNLNDISFTTNVGLGFNYKFSRQFIFNLEPMFKYQLNPYSDNSTDFRPYYIGVYSGFSFSF